VIVALLAFVVLGAPTSLTDLVRAHILTELMTLSYSRGQEAESDDYSVRYLASTGYACDGTAGFFAKLLEEGNEARIPEVLSDHPDPQARVAAVQAKAAELGCRTVLGDQSRWEALRSGLPESGASEEGQQAETPGEG